MVEVYRFRKFFGYIRQHVRKLFMRPGGGYEWGA
jgi:hypothetical protein